MKRLYKIFLVEDEIVTREGIRDTVDWLSAGFEFCGEAPDGEMALPLIQAARPDAIITDIKMPFMNGLELCRIVRETMPHIKTIILSGHDEFAYAREAIKLGVSEYLLKPISASDLQAVLKKTAQQIDRENAEREQVQGLQAQIADRLTLERERFLLRLVLGGVPSIEALEKGMQLKLNMIARCYLVMLIRAEICGDRPDQFDFVEYQKTEQIIAEVVNANSDALAFKKGLEETVVILKGDSFEHLEQDSYLLVEAVKNRIEAHTQCRLTIRVSAPCERLGELPRMFFGLLESERSSALQAPLDAPSIPSAKPSELLKLDLGAAERYLKLGSQADFDRFFDSYIAPIQDSVLTARMLLEYFFIDLLITSANFVNDLGGSAEKMFPELGRCEQITAQIQSLDQLRNQAGVILIRALDFRDQHIGSPTADLIARARAYIDTHFDDPELSLTSVATQVNLSPSHFSVVFSRESGETFIGYFTRKRIEKAMELLRNTSLRTAEISERIGYDNPHYFSTVFRKFTGLTPTEFRSKSQPH